MAKQNKYLLLSTVAFASFGMSAYTQEADETIDTTSEQVEDELGLDVIVVEGIRQSLESALEQKRSTTNLIETIQAEDVGKLPDQNIAEVLENIPGVQITRDNGVGSTVSIRGSDQNRVEINGRGTAPAEDARGGVELSDLPSELVSSLVVVKTPTADMVEGSLGGTINIVTNRGLSLKKPIRSLRFDVERDDLADNWNQSISGTFGDKFETSFGDVGVVLSAVYRDQLVRGDNANFRVRGVTNLDIDGDGINDSFLDRRNFGEFRVQLDDRETTSFNGSLEWQATDQLKLFVDGSVTDFTREVSQTSIINGIAGGGFIGIAPNLDEAVFGVLGTPVGPISVLEAGRTDGWQVRVGGNTTGSRETLTTVFALGGEWENDVFKISAEANGSTSDSDTLEIAGTFQYNDVNNPNFLTSAGARQRIDLFFDGRVDPYTTSLVDDGDASRLSDPENFVLFVGRDTDSDFSNSNYAQRIDVDWNLDAGVISSIEAGFRSSQRSSERERLVNASPTFPGVTLASTGFASNTPDELFGSSTDYLTNVAVFDPSAFHSNLQGAREALFLDEATEQDPAQFFQVDEDTYALYAKFNLETELLGRPLKANLGLRYVDTSQTTAGFTLSTEDSSLVEPINVTSEYDDFLPSASAVLGLTDDVQLRFGYARILRRPDFADLSPTVRFPLTDAPVRRGNPELEPTTADQFDVALEYYFAPGSVFSLGAYYKELDGVIGTNTVFNGIFNPRAISGSTGEEGALVTLVTPENLDGGTIQGIEVAFQHSFTSLPGPFDGLGVIANYAYQDGDRDQTFNFPAFFPDEGELPLPFTRLSEDSYNFTLFYEKYGFSGRIRYTWRSEFLINEAPVLFDEAREQLNASLSYNVNENIALNFSAVNLTEELEQSAAFFEDGPTQVIRENGRRFTFGVRARF